MQGLFGTRFHTSENALALRLNGWTKLSICILVSVVTLFINHNPAMLVLLSGTTLLAVTQLRPKVILILYLIIALMVLLSIGSAFLLSLAFAKYSPMLENYSLDTMVTPFLRLITVLQLVVVTALSTSPRELLINLKSARLPRFLYLPVLVMLRFVPTFINDLRQINESLKTRNIRITFISIVTHPLLTLRCSVIPLIFRALRASDELAIASEIKGVGHYRKTTSCKSYSFKAADGKMLVTALLLLGTALSMQLAAPKKPSMHGSYFSASRSDSADVSATPEHAAAAAVTGTGKAVEQ